MDGNYSPAKAENKVAFARRKFVPTVMGKVSIMGVAGQARCLDGLFTAIYQRPWSTKIFHALRGGNQVYGKKDEKSCAQSILKTEVVMMLTP
jgi:hypothetical protein